MSSTIKGEGTILTGGMTRWYDPSPEGEAMKGENLKKITVAENKFEADLIAQTLQEEGIPCMIRSYHDTAYDGIFIPQKGWAGIMVPEALEEKARAIITELRQGLKAKEQRGGPEENSPS
jgi:ketol-acid reductoisomerase